MVSAAAGDPLSLTVACRRCEQPIYRRCKRDSGIDSPTHKVRVEDALALWAQRIAWIRHTLGRVK